MNRRIGKFTLPIDWVEAHPEEVVAAFNQLQIIVTRAESMYHSATIEYIAISPFLDEVKLGYVIPDYFIEATTHDEGETTYKFKHYESGSQSLL